ncbi:murein biosynthesis integral membrane protein MurJ, partial [Pectobacterium atrosepticum]|nr:murein biosynthesis integral membrane protein MurJ [Pectobacterium atrosepticum]
PSGFTPILFNIIVISSTYIFAKPFGDPAAAMSYGVVAGGLVQAVFQLPFVLKTGFSFKFTSLAKTFSNPGTKKVLALIGPTIIGMAAYQINDLVSTSLATSAGLGIASSLQYSLRLQELLLGIFAVSVGTVILPEMSALALRKDWEAFQKVLLQAIKVIALITIPATFFSLLSGENLIILIYKS